jgi:hypothetical protein
MAVELTHREVALLPHVGKDQCTRARVGWFAALPIGNVVLHSEASHTHDTVAQLLLGRTASPAESVVEAGAHHASVQFV